MVDGTHRKRINCLISTQRGTGQAPERGGDGDGKRKGKERVKREQATDESPSVFRGEQEYW